MEEQQKKDSRSVIILLFPVGLLFISLVLLFALGFRFYYKGNNDNDTIRVVAAPEKKTVVTAAPAKSATRDSLQMVYRTTVNELDNRLDSIWNNTDTLAGSLPAKLNEFYKLRKDITGLLKTGSSETDLALAGQKIADLQQKIIELTQHSQDVEEENKRLKNLVSQLQQQPKTKEQPVVVKPVNTEVKPPAPKTTVANPVTAASSQGSLTASDIRLNAVKLADNKEEETADAEQADKLVASFTVKNNTNEYNNTEVEVVVLQPDGEVLQSSAWETGTFNTAEGKKVYTKKLKFDYLKGDNKHLRVSLSAEKLQQGNYTLQVYHNGKMIGKTVKQLG